MVSSELIEQYRVLVDQYDVLRDRIHKAQEQAHKFKPAVIARVLEDYEKQRHALEDQLAPCEDQVFLLVEAHDRSRAQVLQEQMGYEEQRDEIELRHLVGEFKDGEYQALLDQNEADLSQVVTRLEQLQADLETWRALLERAGAQERRDARIAAGLLDPQAPGDVDQEPELLADPFGNNTPLEPLKPYTPEPEPPVLPPATWPAQPLIPKTPPHLVALPTSQAQPVLPPVAPVVQPAQPVAPPVVVPPVVQQVAPPIQPVAPPVQPVAPPVVLVPPVQTVPPPVQHIAPPVQPIQPVTPAWGSVPVGPTRVEPVDHWGNTALMGESFTSTSSPLAPPPQRGYAAQPQPPAPAAPDLSGFGMIDGFGSSGPGELPPLGSPSVDDLGGLSEIDKAWPPSYNDDFGGGYLDGGNSPTLADPDLAMNFGSPADELGPLGAPSSTPPMTAFLIKNYSRPDEERNELHEAVTSIGRGRDNQIQIKDDTKVSRYHCRVLREADGYYVEDNNSSNGTLVNGVAVNRAKVEGGEEVTIGETIFRFIFA